MDCVFCSIIKKEVPADIVFEDDKVIVFSDIKPKASTHLLFVPKKHIESVNQINLEDKELIGHLFLTIKEIAFQKKINNYKLAINVGRGAGQEVLHLHIHLLSIT